MHSSRMRTGRSLTVCQSLLPGGACSQGGAWSQGCAWSRGCLLPGGPALGGLLLGEPGPRGVPGPRGCLVPGRGGIPACTEADPPREQNDRQVQKYSEVAAGKNF